MLREEVLKGWGSLKEKINQVKLSPADKAVWKFLENSKTGAYVYDDDMGELVEDLDDLEKKIKAEREEENGLPLDGNDLLIDYQICWEYFNSLILVYIELRKFRRDVCNTLGFFSSDENIIEELKEKKGRTEEWRDYTKSIIRDLKKETDKPVNLDKNYFLVDDHIFNLESGLKVANNNVEKLKKRLDTLKTMISGYESAFSEPKLEEID